jgi:LmbE family N-acetylglucosaminyl deacetylase
MNVLVLAAHPDDETLGCGATIHKHASRGDNVCVMTFTNGSASRGPSSSDRRHQLYTAGEILGFQVLDAFPFPDNAMDGIPLLDVIHEVEKTLTEKKYTPDVVYTHSPACLNVDHRVVFEVSNVVFRGGPSSVYCFEVPSSTEWDLDPMRRFVPNHYSVLSPENVQAKMNALTKAYDNELRSFPHPRSTMALSAKMRSSGSEIMTSWAERFQMVRGIAR